MDFEALIKKHVGENGGIPAAEIGKVASAIATAVGREFVDKKRYGDKLEEIETLTREKQTAEDAATAAANWKKKYDDQRQMFDDYKAEIAGKETLSAKKAAHRKLLEAKNINSADIDLIMAATNYDDMSLDKDGALADADGITKSIEQNYARYIPTVTSKGDNPATPPTGNNGGGNGEAIRALTAQWHASKYGEAKTN